MSNSPNSQLSNFDWHQLSLEQLKTVQSQVSRAIESKHKALDVDRNINHVQQNFKYKATVSQVFPKSSKNNLLKHKSCVLVASLNSKNFQEKRIEASIQWISNHFDECIILVGDSIYRLTLSIRNPTTIDNSSCYSDALCAGREFINQNSRLFEKYSGLCDFKFQLASEIEKNENFKPYHQEFQRVHEENKSFAQVVHSFSEHFLRRDKQVNALEASGSLENYQRKLAINYLLEESALFTCLAESGYCVFVYPGSIKTFEEIAEGRHPEVPSFLKQIIWVSLRLKKKNVLLT